MRGMQHTAQRHSPLHTAGFAHPARNVDALDIHPGMLIADFGSGSGAYALAMAERLRNEGRIYAIDVQKDLLRRIHHEAQQRGFNNVDVIWADLEKPHAAKMRGGTLDLVLISNLLFQVEDKAAVLKEARRVLHDGGRLVLIDWSDSFSGMGPHKKSVVTKAAALALAREQGFELLREFPAGAHHWGLVLRLSGHGTHKVGIRKH
jgi:ubiquinone/menaquinone biosynthesis C-methylase UbiE